MQYLLPWALSFLLYFTGEQKKSESLVSTAVSSVVSVDDSLSEFSRRRLLGPGVGGVTITEPNEYVYEANPENISFFSTAEFPDGRIISVRSVPLFDESKEYIQARVFGGDLLEERVFNITGIMEGVCSGFRQVSVDTFKDGSNEALVGISVLNETTSLCYSYVQRISANGTVIGSLLPLANNIGFIILEIIIRVALSGHYFVLTTDSGQWFNRDGVEASSEFKIANLRSVWNIFLFPNGSGLLIGTRHPFEARVVSLEFLGGYTDLDPVPFMVNGRSPLYNKFVLEPPDTLHMVWTDGGSGQVYYKRVVGGDREAYTPLRVNEMPSAAPATFASIVLLKGQYPLVCWVSFAEELKGIVCRFLDGEGNLLGGSFVLSNLTLGYSNDIDIDTGRLRILPLTFNSLWSFGGHRVVLMGLNFSFGEAFSSTVALNFSVEIVLP